MHSLSLEIVHKASVNHVAAVYKKLGTPHGLDEVVRSFHFRHELDEELGASIGVHALHQTVDGSDQAGRVGKAIVVFHGGIYARGRIRGNVSRDRGTACRAED